MNYSKFTSKRNKLLEKKVCKFIIRKFRDVLVIIDYGSQVVNVELNNSDLDYIVIVKPSSLLLEPRREEISFAGRKLSLNIITFQQFQQDIHGKYAYYYISKLINPLNLVYTTNNLKKKLEIMLGLYLEHFISMFTPSGKYNSEELTKAFFKMYIDLFPHYAKYFVVKLSKYKLKLWKEIVQSFRSSFKCTQTLNKNVILISSKYDHFSQNILAEKIRINWYIYGLKIRGYPNDYPKKIITKNKNWLMKNKEKYKQVLKFLINTYQRKMD